MDTTKYKAISREIAADLDALAKKYDLSNYSFIGFMGEPNKGHVPICLHSVTKPKFKDHFHLQLAKVVFMNAMNELAKTGGNVHEVKFDS